MNNNTLRLEKVRNLVSLNESEAVLITDYENHRYLSGFTGSSGWLIITLQSSALCTDGRYWAQAAEESPDYHLIRFRHETHTRMSLALNHYLQEHTPRITRLYFDPKHLTYADYRCLNDDLSEVDLTPALPDLNQIRQIKDEQELQLLKEAAAVSDRAFVRMLSIFKPGLTELELCRELEYFLVLEGARKPSFDSIVASGINGAYPHAGVTDKPIASGELVTIDFGALKNGYVSDMTRTIWWGELDNKTRAIYQTVKDAQAKAIDAARPGIKAKELDLIARDYIRSQGFGDYFTHSLGHGIGLAVHEEPVIRSITDTILEQGMVITIEPGIYIPGYTGCRIEDTVIITSDGCEVITHAPKQETGQHHPIPKLT